MIKATDIDMVTECERNWKNVSEKKGQRNRIQDNDAELKVQGKKLLA